MIHPDKRQAKEQEDLLTVLGVDTSQPFCSITVIRGGERVGEMKLHSPLPYARYLLPSVSHLLTTLDLTVKDIDLFAVATGPGSFTGIRIGISSIMGMAAPDGKPAAGISSLRALAWKSRRQGNLLIPLIPTARDLFYSGLYEHKKGDVRPLREDRMETIETLASSLPVENSIFCGVEVEKMEPILKKTFGHGTAICRSDPYLGNAVASLGLEDLTRGCDLSLDVLAPNYIRPSDAEYKFLEKGN